MKAHLDHTVVHRLARGPDLVKDVEQINAHIHAGAFLFISKSGLMQDALNRDHCSSICRLSSGFLKEDAPEYTDYLDNSV